MRIRSLIAASVTAVVLSVPHLTATRGEETVIGVAGRSSQTPWAAALGDFVAVAFGATTPAGKADVFVAVSRDSGRRFSTPVRVNAVEGEARLGGELPPRVGLVARGSGDPEIVVVYGAKAKGTEIRVSRSTDGGGTFAPSRALQAAGAPGDRGWHAMALDAQGVAHVMWLDHRGLAAATAGDHRTHGAQAAGSAAAHDMEKAAIDGVAMAERSGLFYARDGGEPTGERELAKGVCYCCKVALATTPSGGLNAAWRHVYPGNIRDIAFIASSDGGRHFSAASRVSLDDWHLAGCPDDGPAMSVDGRGTAHLVWPTVLSTSEPEGALFYASSADGKSFTPRVRIPTLGSPKPMHPQVLAISAERVVVAWDEVLNGVRQAAVRSLRFDEAGQPIFGAAERLGAPDSPSSYPLLVSTPRGTLAVYVSGKPGAAEIRVKAI
jgi:hypothetical protein